jgi:hypothetical protein
MKQAQGTTLVATEQMDTNHGSRTVIWNGMPDPPSTSHIESFESLPVRSWSRSREEAIYTKIKGQSRQDREKESAYAEMITQQGSHRPNYGNCKTKRHSTAYTFSLL